MILLAALFGTASSVAGLYISYWSDLPSGPTIVLLSGAIFALALLFAPRSGLVAEYIHHRRVINET